MCISKCIDSIFKINYSAFAVSSNSSLTRMWSIYESTNTTVPNQLTLSTLSSRYVENESYLDHCDIDMSRFGTSCGVVLQWPCDAWLKNQSPKIQIRVTEWRDGNRRVTMWRNIEVSFCSLLWLRLLVTFATSFAWCHIDWLCY